MKTFWYNVLPGVDTERVNERLKSLPSDIRERLFPVLDLNDIIWDEVLVRKCMESASDDEEETRERDNDTVQSMSMVTSQ